jgi:hypothetical protein
MIGVGASRSVTAGTLGRVQAPDVSRLGVVTLFAGAALLLAFVIAGLALEVMAIAFAMPVLLAVSRRPQVGVLLLAALVPFNGLLIIANVPGSVAAWKEALVVLVVIATFVCPSSARAQPERSLPGWLPALAVLLVIGLISATIAFDTEAIVGLKVDFFYVLLALAVWRCPLDARERDRLVSIFMATGVVCALVGLWQQAVGDVALHRIGYEYNTTIRSAGPFLRSFSTFGSPFAFAFYEMLVLLVCVPIALADTTRLRNRLFLFVTPVCLLGMLSSVVRAAVLGLGLGLAYLGFRRYRALVVGLPLALVAIVVLGVLGGSLASSFSQERSFVQRRTGWEENFNQIVQHPLGVGIGTTGAAAEKAVKLTTSGNLAELRHTYNPDNYYFKAVYELGVLGLWMFVLVLVAAFASTRLAVSTYHPRDGPLLDGIGALILAAAAASLVANFFDAFPLDLDFWLLVAVAATLGADLAGANAEPDEVAVARA